METRRQPGRSPSSEAKSKLKGKPGRQSLAPRFAKARAEQGATFRLAEEEREAAPAEPEVRGEAPQGTHISINQSPEAAAIHGEAQGSCSGGSPPPPAPPPPAPSPPAQAPARGRLLPTSSLLPTRTPKFLPHRSRATIPRLAGGTEPGRAPFLAGFCSLMRAPGLASPRPRATATRNHRRETRAPRS